MDSNGLRLEERDYLILGVVYRFRFCLGSDVLIEIYDVSISKPQSVKEQLKSTHSPITSRIERLEEAV